MRWPRFITRMRLRKVKEELIGLQRCIDFYKSCDLNEPEDLLRERLDLIAKAKRLEAML